MKKFTRVEPTVTQTYGKAFTRPAIIKRFRTEDGLEHEFTTTHAEGSRGGCVIALTPEHDVVVAYQFRAGPERWMWELPGGEFHPSEDPLAAAKRELEEETGYTSNRLDFLGTTCRQAYMNETWFCYIAYDCHKLTQPRRMDPEEIAQGLEVRIISIADLLQNAKTDQMTDPAAVLMAYEKLVELQGAVKGNS